MAETNGADRQYRDLRKLFVEFLELSCDDDCSYEVTFNSLIDMLEIRDQRIVSLSK
jgi:hypothetical protein